MMLQEAIKTSSNMRQVLQQLGLSSTGGGSYNCLLVRMRRLKIDRSHMLPTTKGQKFPNAQREPLKEILVKDSSYQNTNALKGRLIKEKKLAPVCNMCGRKIWNKKLIPLDLHHKNGQHFDHRLENLELLCPNCHRQTDNHGSKNTKSFMRQ